MKDRKVVKQKTMLKDLIDKIDWLMITPGRTQNKLLENNLMVSFNAPVGSTITDSIRIRFGKALPEQLGWKEGDKIAVFHDPDDVLSFLLCKTENGSGYTLYQENNSPAMRIQFKWKNKLVLQKRPQMEPEFEIHKKKIVFRIGSSYNENPGE